MSGFPDIGRMDVTWRRASGTTGIEPWLMRGIPDLGQTGATWRRASGTTSIEPWLMHGISRPWSDGHSLASCVRHNCR
jgi:hypothetical protein